MDSIHMDAEYYFVGMPLPATEKHIHVSLMSN